MLVYVAYGLIVLHVAFGILQSETSPVLIGLMIGGFVIVLGLHLFATLKESAADQPLATSGAYVAVCNVEEIPEKRAKIATIAGDRVAIFRYDGKISAVANACQHQNGPLGEGRIIDGFITCPWHGYQYCPHNGQSPAPFTEKIPTFNVKIENGQVWVATSPNKAGTEVQPAVIQA